MRKFVYAIAAGSLALSGAAYAASTSTPAKTEAAKPVKAKQVKHAKKTTPKAAAKSGPKSS